MKTFIKIVLAVALFVSFTGCKGMEVFMDLTAWKKPIGTVRFSPANDPPTNVDCEVNLKIKRNGATLGTEDVEVNVRMPGSRTVEKKAEEKRDLLPIPQLLTSTK